MIIVEGPDNSGKSTLIEQLSKELGLKIIPKIGHGPTQCTKDLYDRTKGVIDEVIKSRSDRTIVDRFSLIGEEIYGPLLRGKNLWDSMPKEKIRFWKSVNIMNPFVIYCRPPLDVILNMATHQVKVYDTHEHLLKVREKQELIVEAYDNYFANWKSHNFFIYNYKDGESYIQLKLRLKEYI